MARKFNPCTKFTFTFEFGVDASDTILALQSQAYEQEKKGLYSSARRSALIWSQLAAAVGNLESAKAACEFALLMRTKF